MYINTHIRLLGIAFVTVCVFWIWLFVYSIHAAMPFNPIELPFADNIRIRIFMPQGWKFFTRSPREDDTKLYKKGYGEEWKPILRPNGSPANSFGLDRVGRSQGVEMGLLMVSIREIKSEWSECKESLEACSEKAFSNGIIMNSSPNPTICGEVVFIQQPPVPWAWSLSKKEVIMPSKVNKVHVLCQ